MSMPMRRLLLTLALGATPTLPLGMPTYARAADPALQDALAAAQAHFAARRYDQALDVLRRVEAQVGDDVSVRWNIARCLEELGRVREAITAFEQARAVARRPADRIAADGRIEALRARMPGALIIECAGGRAVLDDGREARCPARFDPIAPGRWRGRVLADRTSTPFVATVAPGGSATIAVEVETPSTAAPDWPIWVAIGGAALLAAGGIFAMVDADRHAAAAQDAIDGADRAGYDAAQADYDTMVALGYTAYGLSVALAGFAGWLIVDRDEIGRAHV